MRRTGAATAPLVAAPKQQDLLHLHPAPEQRAVIPVRGKQDVFVAHGTGNADRDRFLPERNRVGAEPARALQRHGLQVEGAREHHATIKREQEIGIGGKLRQWPRQRCIGREIGAAADRKLGNDRKFLVRRESRIHLAAWYAPPYQLSCAAYRRRSGPVWKAGWHNAAMNACLAA